MKEEFYLDPDFRKDAPRSGDFCVRCQKPLNDHKFKAVVVDWNKITVRLDPNGGDKIGINCWNVIKKADL